MSHPALLVSFLKASLTRPSRARIPQPQHGQRAPAGGATLTDAGASRARLPQASLLTITRKQVCLPTRLAAHCSVAWGQREDTRPHSARQFG